MKKQFVVTIQGTEQQVKDQEASIKYWRKLSEAAYKGKVALKEVK